MENIIVKYTADTSGIRAAQAEVSAQLDVQKAKEQELLKQMQQARNEYNARKMAAQQAGKAESQRIAETMKAHEDFAKEQQDLRKELNNVRGSIAELSAQFDDMDKTIVKGALNTKFSSRLKEIRNELQQMEMAGETSSQRFIDLSVEAAGLQDQIGDTAAQIRALSSDTKGLDAAVGVGQGLAGTFALAQGAMALFGGTPACSVHIAFRYSEIDNCLGQIAFRHGEIENCLGQMTFRYSEIDNYLGQIAFRHGEIENRLGQITFRHGEVDNCLVQMTFRYSEMDNCLGQITFHYSEMDNCLGQMTFHYSEMDNCLGQMTFRYSEMDNCLG